MSPRTTPTLAEAFAHHQRGDWEQAARLYQAILSSQPDNADALHLLGLLHLQTGEPRRAIELIGLAIALNPGMAAYHANLAEACRTTGQPLLAARLGVRALQLQPGYPEAHNNLGLALIDLGRIGEAAEQFAAAVRLRPDYAMAHNNLGNIYRLRGDIPQALTYLRRALELDGNLVEAHSNLGQLLLERRELEEALAHCQFAARLQPKSPQVHNNLGNVLAELGRLAEAKACYTEALRLNPNLAMVHSNLGRAAHEEGQLNDAVRWYQQAIHLAPNMAVFHARLGDVLADQQEYEKAIACYQTALRLEPNYAEAYNGLGWVEHEQNRFEQARTYYQEAIRLKPGQPLVHCRLGQVLQELSDFAGAESSLREALRHDRRNTRAYHQLANLLGGRLPEPDLEEMKRLAAAPLLSDGQRASLLFGLAYVHDARGEYDRAGTCLRQANALQGAWRKQRGQDWDPDEHVRFVDRLLATFTPDFFTRTRGWGSNSERPVFLIGLPRSGTTLLEQILASHSQVFGAGELHLGRSDFLALAPGADSEQCFAALNRLDRPTVERLAAHHLEQLQALDSEAARVTDKMPENYLYLGLLATLFPRAKFIHCRRDLRDMAVSCWMTNFQSVRWSYDPEHIFIRFREYRRLLAHWLSVRPVPILEIDYEQTVADLEGVARRLLDWCGLDWEPSCLAFHQTRRPVRTASVTQVRQPIYTRSVARWKHYEPALGPLFRQLETL